MNGVIGILGVLAILLVAGGIVGLFDRRRIRWGWLLAAAGLVALNDVLLTRGYGLIPDLLGGELNWQGKLMALAATLALAALPALGWRRCGITLRQDPAIRRSCLAVAAGYVVLVLGLALLFPNGPVTREDLAFQLTLPGIEEELFYRGILLFALDRAFVARVRFLGVEWGWGALLSCMLFGLAHAFGYGSDGFSFEPVIFAATAVPSLAAVWLRYRSGSLLWPIALHNFGNTAALYL